MSPDCDQIYATALSLPAAERAELASRLWDSLTDDFGADIAKEWDDEIQRRLVMIERGEAQWIAHEDVIRRLKEKHGIGGD
jgi:putative addiction module component (TIGR02574 family)